MKKIKVAVIGTGQRGFFLLNDILLKMSDVQITALCDKNSEYLNEAQSLVAEKGGYKPVCRTNYQDVLDIEDISAVIISTAWESHFEIAIEAMKKGKAVGLEMGGVYSIEECHSLVSTSEMTKSPCMMLENCCYGRKEMMCLNMRDMGEFGEIVHCSGGYHHDLRKKISEGYRLNNYITDNCDNYSTHSLGPISKLLNINNGNAMVSLVAFSSKASGMNDYALNKLEEGNALINTKFSQGDIINTIIRCANGETIRLTLDTTLPRFYSRGLAVHGTQGYYEEATNSIYLDKDSDSYGNLKKQPWMPNWNNTETRYAEKFDHPLWKEYLKEQDSREHQGMSFLVVRAFLESVAEKKDMPIDVYDCAVWMCIAALTKESIEKGGIPIDIPDFTQGKWAHRPNGNFIDKFRLDIVK